MAEKYEKELIKNELFRNEIVMTYKIKSIEITEEEFKSGYAWLAHKIVVHNEKT